MEVEYNTVHRIVRYELNAKLKVPRPRHHKQAPGAVEQFKKKLPLALEVLQEVVGADTPLRYFCQDEKPMGVIER